MTKKKPDQYRQGHILLERRNKLPRDAVKADYTPGHVVIATGETGREHVFKSQRVELFQAKNESGESALFIEVIGDAPVELYHEQHGYLEIEPGTWELIEQREEDPEHDRPRRSFPD